MAAVRPAEGEAARERRRLDGPDNRWAVPAVEARRRRRRAAASLVSVAAAEAPPEPGAAGATGRCSSSSRGSLLRLDGFQSQKAINRHPPNGITYNIRT